MSACIDAHGSPRSILYIRSHVICLSMQSADLLRSNWSHSSLVAATPDPTPFHMNVHWCGLLDAEMTSIVSAVFTPPTEYSTSSMVSGPLRQACCDVDAFQVSLLSKSQDTSSACYEQAYPDPAAPLVSQAVFGWIIWHSLAEVVHLSLIIHHSVATYVQHVVPRSRAYKT